MPEKMVAQKMGMCLTSLKKVCRAHGITRWPFRKLKSLERTMKKVNEDSNTITAQLGKSGIEAARACKSSESSRAPSPMKLNCVEAKICPAAQAGSSQQVVTPGTPKATHSPKAEWAVRDHCARNQGESNDWPSFSVSGLNMQELIITNWSALWTVHHLNKRLVKPLGGSNLNISEDGTKAYLTFPSSLAAVQARKVCEEACDLLQAQGLAVEAGTAVKEEAAATRPFLATLLENSDVSSAQASANLRFVETDTEMAVEMLPPTSTKISPFTGPQRDEDDSNSWMFPSMQGAPSSSAANRWASSLLSPPQSCGSQSFGSDSSAHSDAEWMTPCLVSC